MKHCTQLICLLLALFLVGGCGFDRAENTLPQEAPPNITVTPTESGKLAELMGLIDECYIGDADQKAMEDAAAAAIVAATGDQWSYYIPADEYQAHMETMNNAYVGIGITIQVREDEAGFDIMKVEENGPAYEAGLRAGDILTHANGQAVGPLGIDGASKIVKGEEGTTVEVTVERDGKPLTFTVERRTIQVVVAKGQMLPGKVGLVTITNFDARCAQESITAVESLLKDGATAIIFDVRFNPGGYAHEMVALLDYLLPEGDLFISEDYRGVRQVDTSDKACLEVPMVVLVNQDSYSAAEFFAAALRDYDWATVVGQKTTGKGYFQRTYVLSDGSAVNLSVGKYFTPGGVSLAETGLTPDVEVEVDEELYMQMYYGNVEPADDPQIQAALKALKSR